MPSTLVFTPKYAGEGVSGNGGEELTGDVPVYLIFTGGSNVGFGFDGSLSTDAITSAVRTLLASNYLSDLSEYGATTTVHLAQTFISPANPPASYSLDDISNIIQDSLTDGSGPLPEPDDTNPSGIYIVITPQGFTQVDADGAHDEQSTGSFLAFDPDFTDFAGITSTRTSGLMHTNDAPGTSDNAFVKFNALDSITTILSHELVETLTDPDPGDGIVTNGSSAFGMVHSDILQSPGEIADNEGQFHWGFVNGVIAQSYWSQQNGAFIIPDGSLAKVTLAGTALTVFGDTPGGSLNDTVGIDRTIGGGLRVTINGEVLQYDPGVVTSVNLQLGAGNNTVVGTGGTNTWHITGIGSGDLNGFVTFAGAQNLQGGAAADQFQMLPGGSITGSINGGGGADTLDDSGLPGPVIVSLETHSGTGISSFSGIRNFIGSASAADVIVGGATWDITGPNAGADRGSTFSSFENLSGDNLGDQFVFLPGGGISGNIKVGNGFNTLDYSGIAGPVTVDLQTGAATGVGGTFGRIDGTSSGIDNVVGSASSADTLIGPDANAAWVFDGLDSGSINASTFTSFENLVGGSGDDQFAFSVGGSVSGNIDGGGGANLLDLSRLTTPVTITLGATPGTGTATGIGGAFRNITDIIGSSAGASAIAGPNINTVWTITGVNTVQALGYSFGNIQTILGGSAKDTFAILSGGRLDGRIDGGGGSNSLTYAAYTGDVTVALLLHRATAVDGGISNIQNVAGGNGNNLLAGDANANVFRGGAGRNLLIGDAGADTLIGGSNDNILIGNSTAWDANLNALTPIFTEWTRTDLSVEQRIAHLLSDAANDNGLNGTYKLNKKTVVADSAADTLIGGGPDALDWFFMTSGQDTFGEHHARDHLTQL